jgi:hypothetical protein
MKYCKICNLPEYDIEKNIINVFAERRKICEKCFREIKSNYYLQNKDKFKSRYVPRNKPRGRPKKIETKETKETKEIEESKKVEETKVLEIEESKKVEETKVLETSNKTDDNIVNSSE